MAGPGPGLGAGGQLHPSFRPAIGSPGPLVLDPDRGRLGVYRGGRPRALDAVTGALLGSPGIIDVPGTSRGARTEPRTTPDIDLAVAHPGRRLAWQPTGEGGMPGARVTMGALMWRAGERGDRHGAG